MKDCISGPRSTKKHQTHRRVMWKLGLLALVSTIWLMLRTGRKPTRIIYPCQQAAVTNIKIFHLALVTPIPPTIISLWKSPRYLKPMFILSILIVGSVFLANDPFILSLYNSPKNRKPISLNLIPQRALGSNSSDLFIIQNALGEEGNMD
ncbi:MAG: hypothetical protein ACFE9Q_17240, partial [Candidatus Hodarchaeota archaeon]